MEGRKSGRLSGAKARKDAFNVCVLRLVPGLQHLDITFVAAAGVGVVLDRVRTERERAVAVRLVGLVAEAAEFVVGIAGPPRRLAELARVGLVIRVCAGTLRLGAQRAVVTEGNAAKGVGN